ncbi:MAG: LysR family transcriptional regulator [Polyangiaceae bacterium]
MKDPLESAELQAFVKTVDERSLTRAAATLGAPRATLSRRLARLEERLGVRLLRRTTRSLALTDAGESFLRSARIALEALAGAEESVRREDGAIRGNLRVSAPPISAPAFHQFICDFADAHPEVRLEVHTSSRVVDLKRDGYDVAIRAGSELEPGLVARVLSRDPIRAVASPSYLASRGTPRAVKELRDHRLLLGFARGELPQSHWPRVGGGQIHVQGVFASNDIGLLAEAAVRGMGIALLPAVITQGSWTAAHHGPAEPSGSRASSYGARVPAAPSEGVRRSGVAVGAARARGCRASARSRADEERLARAEAGSARRRG